MSRLGRVPKSEQEAFKELLTCVPDDQAKALVDAYRRGDAITEALVSRRELLDRGWTQQMLKKFLPEAVAERYTTRYWLLSRIKEIEHTDEWKATSAKAAARRAAHRSRNHRRRRD